MTYHPSLLCAAAARRATRHHDWSAFPLDHLGKLDESLLAAVIGRHRLIAWAQRRPQVIREPRAFRAEHVDGLGSLMQHGQLLLLTPLHSNGEERYRLPWARLVVKIAA